MAAEIALDGFRISGSGRGEFSRRRFLSGVLSVLGLTGGVVEIAKCSGPSAAAARIETPTPTLAPTVEAWPTYGPTAATVTSGRPSPGVLRVTILGTPRITAEATLPTSASPTATPRVK